MITLNDTEQKFVYDILLKAEAHFGMAMTDPNKCEANRDRAFEYHKMTIKARNILRGIPNKGSEK